MDNETFRSRLLTLVTKSRKALRLYSNVGRFNAEGGNALTELQTDEWRNVTAELLRSLSLMLENQNSRQLVSDAVALRDRFNSLWRSLEAEVHSKRNDLMVAVECGDFVRSAVLSKELVVLKARMQATQAVHHELHDVVRRSKVTQPTIELTREQVVGEQVVDEVGASVVNGTHLNVNGTHHSGAKIIPLMERTLTGQTLTERKIVDRNAAVIDKKRLERKTFSN